VLPGRTASATAGSGVPSKIASSYRMIQRGPQIGSNRFRLLLAPFYLRPASRNRATTSSWSSSIAPPTTRQRWS
jgi:hypothetical protein